jgi:hypothetical protein
MIEPIYLLFAAVTALTGAIATIAIRAPRGTLPRAAAVALTAAALPLGYLALNEILSLPKPAGHEWFKAQAGKATVLGVSLDEGKAIYLWLRLDGSPEPRYYRMPWHVRNAQKLQSAVDRAIEENGVVRMLNPFSRKSWTNQGEINLEVILPPRPPLKHPRPPPRIFNPRASAAQASPNATRILPERPPRGAWARASLMRRTG